jgi:hypothetical protein
MRTYHRKLLIFGGFILTVALGGLLFMASAPKEPAYDGKKLSAWLDELVALNNSNRGGALNTPTKAVVAIGTNALPWLLKELRADGNRLHWRCNQLLNKQSVIKYRFPDVNSRLRRAAFGFQVLGGLAEPAIPDLLKLVEVSPGYVPGALVGIGPLAMPALSQCLTNTRSYVTDAGQIINPIPGNTIGAIHNALNAGRLSKSEVAILVPAIRNHAQSTNRNPAQYDYATPFLRDFDR